MNVPPLSDPAEEPCTSVDYFERMYAADPDPWRFDDSWYEHRKRALTLAALPQQRYRRAFEPGCSNGALTFGLAQRCDEVIAVELLPDVAARARDRLADFAHVRVVHGAFGHAWPSGTGDLVVWSEVMYYLSDSAFEQAMTDLRSWLRPGGTLLAVHYTGATDHPQRGDAVATRIEAAAWLDRVTTLVDPNFELAVWRRGAATSEEIVGRSNAATRVE